MNYILNSYYKKKLNGGRSLVGRILDIVVLRAFLLFSIFLLVLYYSKVFWLAVIISVLITAAISLILLTYKRKKTSKYMQRDMERIKRKCLLEMLTLMKIDQYAAYINRMLGNAITDIECDSYGFRGKYRDFMLYAFHNHPNSKTSVSDIIHVFRKSENAEKLLILSLSEFEDDAKLMCNKLPCQVELIPGGKILNIAEKKCMLPDKECAIERAEKEISDAIVTLKKIKKTAFNKVKIKGYIICGIAIMIWPLISGFRIYYPVISIACFVLAFISFKKNRQTQESSDIGIS